MIVVEHEADAGLDLFAGWLADRSLHVVRPYAGDAVPDDPGEGLIVLGGEVDAYADAAAPWLPATRRLLAAAVEAQVPTLGICLGAQLLAVACDGKVEVGAPAGLEAGPVSVEWLPAAAADPLCAGLPAPFPSYALHADGVSVLPPGATLLGSTRRYPHQVFRVGNAAWGVQFHPEVSVRGFAAWAEQVDEVDAATVMPGVAAAAGLVAAAGELLARRFAALVR